MQILYNYAKNSYHFSSFEGSFIYKIRNLNTHNRFQNEIIKIKLNFAFETVKEKLVSYSCFPSVLPVFLFNCFLSFSVFLLLFFSFHLFSFIFPFWYVLKFLYWFFPPFFSRFSFFFFFFHSFLLFSSCPFGDILRFFSVFLLFFFLLFCEF